MTQEKSQIFYLGQIPSCFQYTVLAPYVGRNKMVLNALPSAYSGEKIWDSASEKCITDPLVKFALNFSRFSLRMKVLAPFPIFDEHLLLFNFFL